jgi:hypothetical protein
LRFSYKNGRANAPQRKRYTLPVVCDDTSCLHADCCTLGSDTVHYLGRLPVNIVVVTEVSRYFPLFLEADADILRNSRPRPLLSTPPVLILVGAIDGIVDRPRV